MRNIFVPTAFVLTILAGCTTLTFQEQQDLNELEYQGVTIDRGPSGWHKPASPLAAGLLNLLPGGGNFYLASGNAGDSSHYMYGFGNLLTWPISILWGIPEAAIDATNINKRDLLNFYRYGNRGSALSQRRRQAPRRQNTYSRQSSYEYERPTVVRYRQQYNGYDNGDGYSTYRYY